MEGETKDSSIAVRKIFNESKIAVLPEPLIPTITAILLSGKFIEISSKQRKFLISNRSIRTVISSDQ
jgi:hypothetical protein